MYSLSHHNNLFFLDHLVKPNIYSVSVHKQQQQVSLPIDLPSQPIAIPYNNYASLLEFVILSILVRGHSYLFNTDQKSINQDMFGTNWKESNFTKQLQLLCNFVQIINKEDVKNIQVNIHHYIATKSISVKCNKKRFEDRTQVASFLNEIFVSYLFLLIKLGQLTTFHVVHEFFRSKHCPLLIEYLLSRYYTEEDLLFVNNAIAKEIGRIYLRTKNLEKDTVDYYTIMIANFQFSLYQFNGNTWGRLSLDKASDKDPFIDAIHENRYQNWTFWLLGKWNSQFSFANSYLVMVQTKNVYKQMFSKQQSYDICNCHPQDLTSLICSKIRLVYFYNYHLWVLFFKDFKNPSFVSALSNYLFGHNRESGFVSTILKICTLNNKDLVIKQSIISVLKKTTEHIKENRTSISYERYIAASQCPIWDIKDRNCNNVLLLINRLIQIFDPLYPKLNTYNMAIDIVSEIFETKPTSINSPHTNLDLTPCFKVYSPLVTHLIKNLDNNINVKKTSILLVNLVFEEYLFDYLQGIVNKTNIEISDIYLIYISIHLIGFTIPFHHKHFASVVKAAFAFVVRNILPLNGSTLFYHGTHGNPYMVANIILHTLCFIKANISYSDITAHAVKMLDALFITDNHLKSIVYTEIIRKIACFVDMYSIESERVADKIFDNKRLSKMFSYKEVVVDLITHIWSIAPKTSFADTEEFLKMFSLFENSLHRTIHNSDILKKLDKPVRQFVKKDLVKILNQEKEHSIFSSQSLLTLEKVLTNKILLDINKQYLSQKETSLEPITILISDLISDTSKFGSQLQHINPHDIAKMVTNIYRHVYLDKKLSPYSISLHEIEGMCKNILYLSILNTCIPIISHCIHKEELCFDFNTIVKFCIDRLSQKHTDQMCDSRLLELFDNTMLFMENLVIKTYDLDTKTFFTKIFVSLYQQRK